MNNRKSQKEKQNKKKPNRGWAWWIAQYKTIISNKLFVSDWVFCDLEDLWHFIKNFLITENWGLSTCEALSFSAVQ